MKDNSFFQYGSRGCFISLVSILLAIGAMAVSTSYQYPQHPFCRGMLGAGFPALFICDDWGGGSPTGSWGRIDFVDVLNGGIRPYGFLLDFLFYVILIWIGWFVLARILTKSVNQRVLWWGTMILFVFIAGFLCSFLTFQSSDWYTRDIFIGTPTPIIPSPTSSEIAPPPSTPTVIPIS